MSDFEETIDDILYNYRSLIDIIIIFGLFFCCICLIYKRAKCQEKEKNKILPLKIVNVKIPTYKYNDDITLSVYV